MPTPTIGPTGVLLSQLINESQKKAHNGNSLRAERKSFKLCNPHLFLAQFRGVITITQKEKNEGNAVPSGSLILCRKIRISERKNEKK